MEKRVTQAPRMLQGVILKGSVYLFMRAFFLNKKYHTNYRFLKRRELAFLGVLGYQSIQSLVIEKNSAEAFIIAPPGFRAYVDKINGFYFFYPETWVQVMEAFLLNYS